MSVRKETKADKVYRSLSWHGDLRDCPELEGTQAEADGRAQYDYWRGDKDD